MEIGDVVKIGKWNDRSLEWYFLDTMQNSDLLFLCCAGLLKTSFINLDNVMAEFSKDFSKPNKARIGLMSVEAAIHYQQGKFMKLSRNINDDVLDWWLLPHNKRDMADVLKEQFPPYFDDENGQIVEKGDRASSTKWFRPVIILKK